MCIGAMGGLAGWFISAWLLDLVNYPSFPQYGRAIIKGVVIGACVSGFICGRERAMIVDWQAGIGDGVKGGLYGAVVGGIAYPVALLLFPTIGLNIGGRIVGFLCLGTFIGAGEGWKWASGQRTLRGMTGGAIGGTLAAILYHLLAISHTKMGGDAIAWIAFGGLLGLSISFACILSNSAVLLVEDAPMNKLQNQYLPLGTRGPHDIVGHSRKVSVPIITDRQLLEEHASITNRNREFAIEPIDRASVFLNNSNQPLKHPQTLNNGDTIRMGDTTFRFLLLRNRKVRRMEDGRLEPENPNDREGILYR